MDQHSQNESALHFLGYLGDRWRVSAWSNMWLIAWKMPPVPFWKKLRDFQLEGFRDATQKRRRAQKTDARFSLETPGKRCCSSEETCSTAETLGQALCAVKGNKSGNSLPPLKIKVWWRSFPWRQSHCHQIKGRKYEIKNQKHDIKIIIVS